MIDLGFTDEEQALRTSVADFIRREASRQQVVDATRDATWQSQWWSTFARAGWLGLATPEALGGLEAEAMQIAVVFEELGKGAVPSPLLDSSIVSSLLIEACDQTPARDALLEEMSAGDAIVSPAFLEPATDWSYWMEGRTRPLAPETATLSATRVYVRHADAATHFLVPVGPATGGLGGLVVVPATAAGVSFRLLQGFLPANFEVAFDGVAIDPEWLLTWRPGVDLDDRLSIARVAVSAFRAGGCSTLLAMAVDYSNTRVQFGQPIGKFQRVQDHVIRILNAREAARWTTYKAAAAVSEGAQGAAYSHLAAAVSADSYVEAANAAHEVFAAIGSDPEFGLTLFTAASRGLYDFLGSPRWHKRMMVRQLGWQDVTAQS